MIYLSLLALLPACAAIWRLRRCHGPEIHAERVWGPAELALAEAEALSPLDAPECPKVDTAYLRSNMAREEYERAYLEAHGEQAPWIGPIELGQIEADFAGAPFQLNAEKRAVIDEILRNGGGVIELPGV